MIKEMFMFKLDDNERKAFHLFPPQWSTFHITKHVIEDFNSENLDVLLGIERKELYQLRDRQKKEFDCGLNKITNTISVCNECGSNESCFRAIKGILDKYRSLITHIMKTDYNKPRHAHTVAPNAIRESLVVLDGKGVSIISKDSNRGYNIKTCYRSTPIGWKKMKLDLERIRHDNTYYYRQGLKTWLYRFSGDRYKSVEMHEFKNWIG